MLHTLNRWKSVSSCCLVGFLVLVTLLPLRTGQPDSEQLTRRR